MREKALELLSNITGNVLKLYIKPFTLNGAISHAGENYPAMRTVFPDIIALRPELREAI